nr:unnamed protein product [Spirometra erinaceieuropaei]
MFADDVKLWRPIRFDEDRQLRGDLIQAYRIVRGRECALDFEKFFELAGTDRLPGHPFKLKRKLTYSDVRRNALFYRPDRSPKPQIYGALCRSDSLITTLAARTARLSDHEQATAATTHILPNHLLRHVDPLSAPRSLRAANGTAIPVSATVSLQLMIENARISHRFLVTPDGPWPIVLGLDFLEAYDCVVHVRERQLTLGRNTSAPAPSAIIDDLDIMYNSVLSAVAVEPTPLDTVLPAPSLIGPVAHEQLKTLLNSFPDLFAWSTDTIGRTHLIQHTIDTGDAKPVWQPP